jgi:hypothetical protein
MENLKLNLKEYSSQYDAHREADTRLVEAVIDKLYITETNTIANRTARKWLTPFSCFCQRTLEIRYKGIRISLNGFSQNRIFAENKLVKNIILPNFIS